MAETIQPVTYGDIIRRYSENVADGYADTDLTPRQRRLTAVMLNLASNGAVYQPYTSLRDEDRDAAVKRLADIMWDARVLIIAASPASDDDVSTAHGRAIAILRGV